MLSSASFTRCSDSLTMPFTTIFSARSRRLAIAVSSLSWTSLSFGLSFRISSLMLLCTRACVSRKRQTPFSVTWPSAAADSASLTPVSEPCPSVSSAATCLAMSITCSSAAVTFALASSTSLLAARRCSTVDASFFHLATSPWAVLSLVWNLIRSALASTEALASLPLASICLAVMNFLASARAVLATASALAVSSAAARMSPEGELQSLLSSSKIEAASPIFFARPSASVTWFSASLMSAPLFLFAVVFFSSVSFLVKLSSCFCRSLSFDVASILGLGENRLASTSLVAMNIRQIDTAVFAPVAATSQALTAVSVSSSGSSSTPIRNGPSASAALPTASCTDCSFSAASLSSNSQVTRSAASLCEPLRDASFCSEFLARSSTLAISSSWMFPAAWLFFCRMNLRAALTLSAAFFMAISAAVSISLVRPVPLSRFDASSALSQSTSAGVSFSWISSTILLATWRAMKSCRTVLSGFSLFCASWS
mmetsp:Transcript_5306/g.12018  ORF Transcript_5306/g.12018 Transcript_5306/m.12018 type:complete len:484 (+) Transcript_5306:3427-4878(+)